METPKVAHRTESWSPLNDSAVHGILILQTDGLCRDSNEAADLMLGYRQSDMRSVPLHSLLHPGEEAPAECAFQSALRPENGGRLFEDVLTTFCGDRLEVDIEDDSAMTEQDSDRTFVAESIEQAMTKLSPGARAVFVLHDIEGYTHGEIGEELGITSGGSKSQLFKARAKLRKLLAHLVDESSTVAVKGKGHVAPV